MATMSNTTRFTVLSNLNTVVNGDLDDEFSKNPVFNSNNPAAAAIVEALKKKRADEAANAVSNAADEIMALENEATKEIENKRASMSDMRKRLDAYKSKIIRIAIARAYGQKTLNYIPLAVELEKVQVTAQQIATNPIFTVPPLEAEKLLAEINAERATAAANKKK